MANARYQVFISSTFDDLQAERLCLWQRLTDYGYIVAGMENFPATSDEPFEYIKPLIEESDYFLLVLGDRYGTEFGNTGKSYTETEYEHAIASGVPVLVFPVDEKTAKDQRSADVDQTRAAQLARLRSAALVGRMSRTWKTPEDLASVVIQGLAYEGQRKPRPGWVRGASLSALELSEDVVRLRQQVDQLQSKINEQSTLTMEEITAALSKDYLINVEDKNSGDSENVWINVGRFLRLESMFEPFSVESIAQSIAVAAASTVFGKKYDKSGESKNLEINHLDIEGVLLFLRSIGVLSFDASGGHSGITHGVNWLVAHEATKFARVMRASATNFEPG